MHDYLRSVGFSEVSRKAEEALTAWVTKEPSHLSIVPYGDSGNLAMAIRDLPGHVGIAAIGEMPEEGEMITDYLFPYVDSDFVSSTETVRYEKKSNQCAFLGSCDDPRMGMTLIFTIKNVAELLRKESSERKWKGIIFTMLLSDATVLLPIEDPDSEENVPSDDIYTMVETFYMPHGMETDIYYFLGLIKTCQPFVNPYTEEEYYRMTILTNDMMMTLAVNRADLIGEPKVGYRIKGHGMLMGELI